jgi:hypothetical protein
VAADPQILFDEAKCYNCFSPASTADLLKLALLSRYVKSLDAMAATDLQSLLDAGRCYACYGMTEVQVLILSLLAKALLVLDPAADVSGEGLLDYAKCFGCISSANTGDMIELALLDKIASI